MVVRPRPRPRSSASRERGANGVGDGRRGGRGGVGEKDDREGGEEEAEEGEEGDGCVASCAGNVGSWGAGGIIESLGGFLGIGKRESDGFEKPPPTPRALSRKQPQHQAPHGSGAQARVSFGRVGGV